MAKSLATLARQQVAAEKKLASLKIIGRATFKATGAVLVGVQSGETVYHLTIISGKICSCIDASTGESCKGRYHRGTCCHSERVMQYEAARSHDLAVAAQAAPLIVGEQFASDLTAHLEDEMPAQPEMPVALRDAEGLWYVMAGNSYTVCSSVDLPAQYREGDASDKARLIEMLGAEYESRVQAELATLPDADSSAMAEIDAMQAEKARKCSLNAPREPKLEMAPSGVLVPMR